MTIAWSALRGFLALSAGTLLGVHIVWWRLPQALIIGLLIIGAHLGIGLVAGAMVLQSTIPVTFGVLLTPWQLGSFGSVAAVFALIAAAIVFVQLRFRARDDSLGLSAVVLGGSLYVVFIAYVVRSVLAG